MLFSIYAFTQHPHLGHRVVSSSSSKKLWKDFTGQKVKETSHDKIMCGWQCGISALSLPLLCHWNDSIIPFNLTFKVMETCVLNQLPTTIWLTILNVGKICQSLNSVGCFMRDFLFLSLLVWSGRGENGKRWCVFLCTNQSFEPFSDEELSGCLS